jgi:RNA polymerase sigma factor (sigma-70 family)
LARFAANRDEEAFGTLVARHGPMVWAVCRDVLRDAHDVEDAFQATFLILVRRAGTLRVEESLGGWLYRVAYHVAIRANREGSRRRTREQGGADLAAFPEQVDDNRHAAELHDAIARLPERYRRPLVLCDLEGMPQLEAARVLRCGEATLRRRLAGARDRLRNRLTMRSVPVAVISRLATISQATLPAGWKAAAIQVSLSQRPASGLAARLAASAARGELFAKGVKLLLVVGLVSVAGAAYAFTLPADPLPKEVVRTPPQVAAVKPQPKPVPKPVAVPEKPVRLEPVHWVHLKSDEGYESWGDCDAGITFTRKGKIISKSDYANREVFRFEGEGTIELTRPDWMRGKKDESGRLVTSVNDDLVLKPTQRVPYRTPGFLRNAPPILPTDYSFDTLDGKKTIRMDQYDHDALGKSRLSEQVWYDATTRRRIRSRELYQLGEQQMHGKEFETIDYDYPETGPADMAALGVPAETKVVDLSKTRSNKWADQAPEVQKAITAQSDSIRKFPRHLRVVTKDDRGTIHLEYSTVNQEFADVHCDNMTRDQYRFSDRNRVRYFDSDNQDYGGRPDDLFPRLKDVPDGTFDADRVAAWFPIDKSVNTGLSTFDMTYNLTRCGPDSSVHVMDQASDAFPEFFSEQWPVVRSRYLGLESLPPDKDTPAGMVLIKTNGTLQIGDRHVPYPHYYTLDPSHDWIAVREVSWKKEYEKETWEMESKSAKAFQKLPNGSWYVSLWETSRTDGLEREKPSDKAPERTGFIRMNVKVLGPDDFPAGIFDGPAFLEKAKKEGLKIEPN